MNGDPFEESDPAATAQQRKQVLMVAEQRPGTNVAKCIFAYEEQPELSRLVVLLDEVSKNSDYSTDLRLSTEYYGNNLLRHCLRDQDVPRRVALGSGGSAIQSFGKIYADRVEYISQTTDNINESMSSAQRESSEQAKASGPESSAPKPEEPRKRRVKKLTQKTVDPFMVNLEPRAFKTMSEEKRFGTAGMAKCSRNRTIEYLYQDHTPPNLWRNAPIVDPHQSSELDEKKQYKLFTYHVEHRYNTLLPDIPFERLNLIKEYVNSNNVSQDILNVHMTTDEYLSEYIALENKMLASRYGATVRARRGDAASGSGSASTLASRLESITLETTMKRTLETEESDASSSKKSRTEEETMEAADLAVDATTQDSAIESSEPMEVDEPMDVAGESLDVVVEQSPSEKLKAANSSDSGLAMTLNTTQLDNSQLENSTLNASQVEGPALCSTLLPALNESERVLDTPHEATNELIISTDKSRDLSSDDEGVVLSDCDERRLQSLSPKVMIRDIFPGVPNKDNFTVVVDDEILALGGVKEEEPAAEEVEEEQQPAPVFEELVKIPIEVCYPLKLNIFKVPDVRLRRRNIFKLPTEFDIFKQKRVPPKREVEPRLPRATRRVVVPAVPEEPATRRDNPMRLSLEFDLDYSFRRPTFDSGVGDNRFFDSRPISVAGSEAISRPESAADAANRDKATQCDEVSNEARPVNDNGLDDIKPCKEEASLHPNGEDSGLEATRLDAATSFSREDSSLDATRHHKTASLSREDSGFDTATQLDAEASLPRNDDGLVAKRLDSILGNLTMNEAPANPSRPESAMQLDDWMEDTDSTQESSDLGVDNPFQIDKGGFTDSSELVRDWHIRIAPMLEVAHERQNFKFEDLGTEIIETCQQHHGRATLANVMEGKDNTTMGRHFFASLKLLNDGNIVLKDVVRDKSKPLDISQYKMELRSTERKQVHPEDDIGNVAKPKPKPLAAQQKRLKRKSTERPEAEAEVHVKMVRLIKAIPKVPQLPDDGDSGISSLASSVTMSPEKI